MGIILAAGASTRMGRPKALLERTPGSTFLARIATTLRDAGAGRLIVVVARPHGPAVAAAARAIGVEPIENPEPALGQVRSMAIGLEAAAPATFALVALADIPDWRAATGRALLECGASAPAAIHVPTFHGVRGHPVVVPVSLAAALRDARTGEGAREVFDRADVRVVEHALEDPGILRDVNVPSDLESLEAIR